LLIAAAGTALVPAYGVVEAGVWSARLYALRNLAAAVTAFPAGALSDRVGRRPLLIAGYALACLVMLGFGHVYFHGVTDLWPWAVLFALAGVFIATEEALEGAAAADLVEDPSLRGTAFGVLGVVNGLGDFVSSVVVGVLLTVAPAGAFLYAAALMATGAALLARFR
jgi:MFS family permease